jgi:hypothetical protein
MELCDTWTDERGWFGVLLFEVRSTSPVSNPT